MENAQTAYMHRPDASFLNAAIRDLPRDNLARALYDLCPQSGVLSGLTVAAQSVPNLTLVVAPGRGVYRDAVSRLAKFIEVRVAQTVNLASLVPGAGSVTAYVVAEPRLESQGGTPVTIDNAPVGAEDYDPTFSTTTLYPRAYDESTVATNTVKAVTAVTGQQIILASVTLSAGQASITNSNIGVIVRQDARPQGMLGKGVTAHVTTPYPGSTTAGYLVATVGQMTTRFDSAFVPLPFGSESYNTHGMHVSGLGVGATGLFPNGSASFVAPMKGIYLATFTATFSYDPLTFATFQALIMGAIDIAYAGAGAYTNPKPRSMQVSAPVAETTGGTTFLVAPGIEPALTTSGVFRMAYQDTLTARVAGSNTFVRDASFSMIYMGEF